MFATLILGVVLSCTLSAFPAEEEDGKVKADSLLVMFWNLENFFDSEDMGMSSSDRDFSPEGERSWSDSRFYRKCRLISKAILWIGSRHGRIPDVMGFAEVENRRTLVRLLKSTALRKMGYRIIHWDSPDHRGIDVALLFREDLLSLQDARPVPLTGMATRDILHVHLESRQTDLSYDWLVCHLPSKYGGPSSEPRRVRAAGVIEEVVDSILQVRPAARVTVMGDFNDVPSSPAFDGLRPHLELVFPQKEVIGTIRFNGKWEWIDLFWTNFAGVRMEIVQIPFLLVKDSTHSGEKPLRTYQGPRYLGGVSDHCPIVLKIADAL